MKSMESQWNRKFVAVTVITFLLWALLFWKGLLTAFDIWWGNEIFNHCLFVIPTPAYLIYQKRASLLASKIKPTLLPLVFILPLCTLYVVGLVGDIQLFMHVAVFILLPALIWSILGHSAAKIVLFPLAFITFAIPVGEQLIPFLQEVTANGSVALLKAVGIPLYRSGLYIEIPAGQFLVAEACSGVSFFIVSIVIGSLFSYLSFVSHVKKIVFVAISIFLPVLANVIRVFGIIYIAHKTDMEYAAGADHLIYGWFFFAFVIICLLGIGELLRDKNMPIQNSSELSAKNGQSSADVNVKKTVVTLCALIVFGVWASTYSLYDLQSNAAMQNSKSITSLEPCNNERQLWQPRISDADRVIYTHYQLNGACPTTLIQADYYNYDTELVSGLTQLYAEKEWSLEGTINERVLLNGQQVDTNFLYLTSPTDQKVKVTKWYEVNERIFTSTIKAKLYVTYLKMSHQYEGGRLLMLAVPQETNTSELRISDHYE